MNYSQAKKFIVHTEIFVDFLWFIYPQPAKKEAKKSWLLLPFLLWQKSRPFQVPAFLCSLYFHPILTKKQQQTKN